MPITEKSRYKISFHLNNLLGKDIATVRDIHSWLGQRLNKPRDLANKLNPKRLVARHLAAEMIILAQKGNIYAFKEIMDRTEGKVADHIVMDMSGEVVHRMEAARQRVLATKTQEQIVEGEITDTKTDTKSCKLLIEKV